FILNILFRYTPAEARLLLADMKYIDFSPYHGVPHVAGIYNTFAAIKGMLEELTEEVNRRFALFKACNAHDLEEYNACQNDGEKLPVLIAVIQEYSYFAERNRELAASLVLNLAQRSRAAGIYLVIASQMPEEDLYRSRLSTVFSSRAVFHEEQMERFGCQDASGFARGECDFYVDKKFLHIKTPYVSYEDVQSVCVFLREQVKE
ncbi:MAG: hypothetical protein J6Z36_00535, partial [Clostridia bacterium]|nr:hypothetical protein [Clostridia bacterium]